jgi:hypothetical protein
LGAVEVEEVVEVGDGYLEPFDRGGKAAGVEVVALLWVGGGERAMLKVFC